MGAKRRSFPATEQPQTAEPMPQEELPQPSGGQEEEDTSLPLQPPIHHQCLALHRSRHWQWNPSSVVAISACPAAPLAAIGFETGDLELWDLVHITCIQRIVGEGVEITALTWACDSLDGSWRTFCAALDGSLAEVQWRFGKLVASSDSGAGAIWALAAQPAAAVAPGFAHPLAASCDDGSVRVFHVEGGETGAHYSRTLARLQGRALAVAWHPSGSALVAGGADGCIHVLDPSNGSEHLRITAGAATSRPVCVWRLAVLPSGTIVSGDSDGAVQFWDGRFGSLLHRFTQHRADVLAVVPSPDGEAVFASGVDPAVALFRHAQGDAPNTLSAKSASGAQQQQGSSRVGAGGGHWVYTHHKRPHTHDVRAMDVVRLGGGRAVLLSGGVDAQLIAYPVASFLEEHPARLTKCPQRPICQLALGSQPHTAAAATAAAESIGNGAGSTPKKQKRSNPYAQSSQQQQQQQQQQYTANTQPPLLLCAQHDTVDVWQLARTVAEQQHSHLLLLGDGPTAANGGVNGVGGALGVEAMQHVCAPIAGESVDLTSGPRHLARIRCGAGRISACAISPDGRFVAAVGGSQGRVRVYLLLPEQSTPTGLANGMSSAAGSMTGGIARVKLPPLQPCSTLTFTHSLLLLAHTDGSLTALSLSHEHPHHTSTHPKPTPLTTASIIAKLGPRDAGSQQQAHQISSAMGTSPAAHVGEGELGGVQAASAWRGFAAPVSHLVAAPNGETAAVAGAGGISLVRLTRSTPNATQPHHESSESGSSSEDDEDEAQKGEGRPQQGAGVSMSYSGKLLRVGHDAPLTSLAFSADSEVLAATLASGNLVIYECASGRPSAWSVEHATEIAACLERLPGTPVGLSFCPDPASRTLIVYSPGGFCTLDTRRAPDCAAAQRSRHSSQKRRRGPLPPHLHHRSGELASLGGGEVAGGPCLDAAPGLRKAGLPGGSGSSGNGRAILLRDPCAFLGHLSPNEAILLEKPWEDVASTFTPPLYTHRYGA